MMNKNDNQVNAGMLFTTPWGERVLILRVEDGCIHIQRRFGRPVSGWFISLLDRFWPKRARESWNRLPQNWVCIGTAFKQGKTLPVVSA